MCVCFFLELTYIYFIVVVVNRLCNECEVFEVGGDDVTCQFCVDAAQLKKKKEEAIAKRLEEKKKQEQEVAAQVNHTEIHNHTHTHTHTQTHTHIYTHKHTYTHTHTHRHTHTHTHTYTHSHTLTHIGLHQPSHMHTCIQIALLFTVLFAHSNVL